MTYRDGSTVPYRDGSLGYMLQGVNQQDPRVQAEGHVRESINMMPNPNTGLSSRPAGEFRYAYAGVPTTALYQTVVLDGVPLRISYGEDYLQVHSYNGVTYTVQDPNSKLPYVGTNMVFCAVDGEIFVLNRGTLINTVAVTNDIITRWGYVYMLGAQYNRTYFLTLTYSDATVCTVSWATPDSATAGAADQTTAENVLAHLAIALDAHANFKATSWVGQQNNTLYIYDTNPAVTFTLWVSDGNTDLLKAGVGTAETFADVPKWATEGSVIRVTGEAGSSNDDVWLRFNASGTTTVGAFPPLGETGVWEETVAPLHAFGVNPDRMPHKLTPHPSLANTFVFDTAQWDARQVGDNLTSPHPSFVGRRITDMGEFQSRLWFIAGGYFCASRTREPTSFYRSTVSAVLATDPIDIRSSNDEDVALEYGVAYDKSLLLFSGNGQFVVPGNQALTPNTAAMSRTTTYEMSTSCRPALMGKTILMPFKYATYSGVNEMHPSVDTESNLIERLTVTAEKYIVGEVDCMAASANTSVAAFITNSANATWSRTVWVYNSLWENSEKVQSAWHRWNFVDRVDHVYARDGELFVWVRSEGSTTTYLLQLRLDKPNDASLSFHASADFKRSVTGPIVDLDRADYQFLAKEDSEDYSVGREVIPESVALVGLVWRYTFGSEAPLAMLAGVPFVTEVEPNPPVIRGFRNEVQVDKEIITDKFVVDYSTSGPIEAWMRNVYVQPTAFFVMSNDSFPEDDDPLDNFAVAVKSGKFEIPWGENADIATLVLRSRTMRPVTYIEIRWYGQVFKAHR